MKTVPTLTSLFVLLVAVQLALCACPCSYPVKHECGPDEVYSSCGSACQKNCNTPPNMACTLQCVEGCFCRPGYIRETEHGRCIPECECPNYYK